MTWALPWLVGAAIAAAALVGVLHLLTRQPAPPLMLPTARFVPSGDRQVMAIRRGVSDRRLLLLRVAALLCLGLGAAGTRCRDRGAPTWHLVVLDSSAVRDSTRFLEALLPTVSPARRTVLAAPLAEEPGTAFVRALGGGRRVITQHSDVEGIALHVLLPATVMATDGWTAWRAQWPAAVDVRLMPADVPADRSSGGAPAGADGGAVAPPAPPSRVVVRWPPRDGRAGRTGGPEAAPRGWVRRTSPDTVGALVAGGMPIVAPWIRRWRQLGSTETADGVPARPVAWWSDGEPAILEFSSGATCERTLGVSLPEGSDLLLAPEAAGLQTLLKAPCAEDARGATLPAAPLLRDSTGLASADRSAESSPKAWPRELPASLLRDPQARDGEGDPRWLTPLLIGAALLLLAGEAWLRRPGARA